MQFHSPVHINGLPGNMPGLDQKKHQIGNIFRSLGLALRNGIDMTFPGILQALSGSFEGFSSIFSPKYFF
jgi:hypothetical protein